MIWFILWWVIGLIPMIYLNWDDWEITWAQLLACFICGLLGPVLFVVVFLMLFFQAEFWSKPIFGKKKEN